MNNLTELCNRLNYCYLQKLISYQIPLVSEAYFALWEIQGSFVSENRKIWGHTVKLRKKTCQFWLKASTQKLTGDALCSVIYSCVKTLSSEFRKLLCMTWEYKQFQSQDYKKEKGRYSIYVTVTSFANCSGTVKSIEGVARSRSW